MDGLHSLNRRELLALAALLSLAALAAVTAAGGLLEDRAMITDFSRKNLPPCPRYPFGTDWMGRNMLFRVLAGLSLSIRIGLLTALASAVLAFAFGVSAGLLGRYVDGAVGVLIDLVTGIPHMLLLVLISFAFGKGFRGVVTGIALTHWTSLARLLRAEVLQLRESPYVKIARKLGESPQKIAFCHLLPHLLPQLFVGTALLFPHAILHEAGITFLGFGLSPEQPAIGVILSESMKYLVMGKWWLALLPGGFLVGTALLFQVIGSAAGEMLDPGQAHR